MAISKVTRNYQITLPKETRRIVDIKIGDEIVVDIDDGEIKIRKFDRNAILRKAFGCWTEIKEDSASYVRKMRAESEKRTKRLGI